MLVDAMIDSNALELLLDRMSKLNEAESEEATAIFNAMGIIDHMVEVKPAVAELVLDKTKLLKWLLGRIRKRGSDSNKAYASELLAILMQVNQSTTGA